MIFKCRSRNVKTTGLGSWVVANVDFMVIWLFRCIVIFGAALLLLSVVLRASKVLHPLEWFAFGAFLIAALILGLFLLFHKRRENEVDQSTSPDDHLHRLRFANRIARYLADENASLRRIAITGPWGEGKTHTLRLIQRELKMLLTPINEVQFSPEFVWINPWKASTKEEAWRVIAEGFKGVRPPVDRLFDGAFLHWVRVGLGFIGYESVSEKVFSAIQTHFSEESRVLLNQVDNAIFRQKRRLYVFVDDMERSEPDAIRGILPVVDRLSEMKNCFFIFGIDRKRLEDAFVHLNNTLAVPCSFARDNDDEQNNGIDSVSLSGQSFKSVTGYLDKVMDLQLELPTPLRHEIVNFAHCWLKELKKSLPAQKNEHLPKLDKAFDKLALHLPLNPRQCEKFLKIAVQTELLFLQNYGENEQNFEALFFLLLGESCCPGFRGHLENSIDKWRNLADHKSQAYFEGINNKTCQTNEFKDFFRNLCRSLHLDAHTSLGNTIKGVLEQIVEHFGFYYLFVGEHPQDPQWLFSGYMISRYLSFEHREAILSWWLRSGNSRHFEELLRDTTVIPREEQPSDAVVAISQTIEGNLKEAVRRLDFLNRDPNTHGEKLREAQEVVDWLQVYAHYYARGCEGLEDFDRQVLEVKSETQRGRFSVVIQGLEELVLALPIKATEEIDWLVKLRGMRLQSFQNVLLCLDPTIISALTAQYLFSDQYLRVDRLTSDSAAELREIACHGRKYLSKLFVNQFAKNDWEKICEWMNREGRQSPFVILQPDLWVPYKNDTPDMDFMDQLINEKDSEILLNNLFDITGRLFLKPLIDEANHDLGFRVRLLLGGENNPNALYVKAFWCLSMKFLEFERRQVLLDLRNNVIEQARSERSHQTPRHLRVATIEDAFPLEN